MGLWPYHDFYICVGPVHQLPRNASNILDFSGCPFINEQVSYKRRLNLIETLTLYLPHLENIRRDLFYLLDYVTLIELFQIGDRKKKDMVKLMGKYYNF